MVLHNADQSAYVIIMQLKSFSPMGPKELNVDVCVVHRVHVK